MEAILRPDIARLIVDQFQNELVWMHVTLLSTAVMRRLEFLRARRHWEFIEVRSAVGFYCFPTARALGDVSSSSESESASHSLFWDLLLDFPNNFGFSP